MFSNFVSIFWLQVLHVSAVAMSCRLIFLLLHLIFIA